MRRRWEKVCRVERVYAKPPMLGASGKASERERVRETCVVTNTDEDTEKQVYRVEKVLL